MANEPGRFDENHEGFGAYQSEFGEPNSCKGELETGNNGCGREFEPPKLESSGCDSEYFPTEKQNQKKNKKKNSGLAPRLIASLATVVTGAGIIIASNSPPPEPLPTVIEAAVIDYREAYTEPDPNGITDGIYIEAQYDIGFSFDMDGCVPLGISIIGERYHENEGGKSESTAIEFEILAEDLEAADDGSLTVVYTVENIYMTHEVKAVLRYTLPTDSTGNANTEQEERTLESDIFIGRVPRLLGSETSSKNTIDYAVNKDGKIELTARLNDLIDGCFEFRCESLILIYNSPMLETDVTIAYGGEGNEPIPEMADGVLILQTILDNPMSDSLVVSIELYGDAYYNGEKMNLDTTTFATRELILGEAFSAEEITFDKSKPEMSANGLTVNSVVYWVDYEGEKTSIDQALPGREILVVVILSGEAAEDATIYLDVSLNEQKITEYSTEYSYTTVNAGADSARIEFSFIMPAENVVAEDIIINGISFESAVTE